MKINPLDKQQPAASPSGGKIRGPDDSNAFKHILDQAVQQKPSEQVRPGAPPQRVAPSSPVSQIEQATQVYDNVHQMLDGLERYQNLLADVKANLRAVEPALQEVREQAVELETLVDKMPAADPVKAIAQEALMVAAKEIVRFDRGEYVDN